MVSPAFLLPWDISESDPTYSHNKISRKNPDPERTVLGAAEWCRTLQFVLDATSRAQGYDVITCGTVLRAIGQETWKWFMEAASFAF